MGICEFGATADLRNAIREFNEGNNPTRLGFEAIEGE